MKENDSDDEEEMPTYKVILIGESEIGKTYNINHFIKEIFKEKMTPSFSVPILKKILN